MSSDHYTKAREMRTPKSLGRRLLGIACTVRVGEASPREADTIDEAAHLLAACAKYLKENETPAERIQREIEDNVAALGLLAKDRAQLAALLAREAQMREALGIDDDTDPVSVASMLRGWEADAQDRADRLEKHLANVIEIARTWQPDYATTMDRKTIELAEQAMTPRGAALAPIAAEPAQPEPYAPIPGSAADAAGRLLDGRTHDEFPGAACAT